MQRTSEVDSPAPTIEPTELVGGEPFDPHSLIEQVMQDCAQCRALRALGGVSLIDPVDDLFPTRAEDAMRAKT